MKKGLSLAEIEKEIAELSNSEYVKLARKAQKAYYNMRQRLYCLRWLDNLGKKFEENGITKEKLDGLSEKEIARLLEEIKKQD
ncbi:MAG: hypothetical protein ACTTK5_01455 [Candidatus Fimenecus sp.]